MKLVAMIVLALVGGMGNCFAQVADPPGERGKAWERVTVRVISGKTVQVVGTNTTKPTASGNWSGISLFANGAKFVEREAFAATVVGSGTVDTNDRYVFVAICTNKKADPGSCTLQVKGENIIIE